jgi:hypothetical protein
VILYRKIALKKGKKTNLSIKIFDNVGDKKYCSQSLLRNPLTKKFSLEAYFRSCSFLSEGLLFIRF